ncbi:unnamed protein product [Rhizopus microsporus]
MFFKYDGYNIGVYEVKKSSREYSDEVIIDEQIEVPKIMKGMLVKLLTVAPTKLRQLETVGIITSDLNIKLLVMNCPNRYVCRISKADTARYPSTEELFYKLIRKCLHLIWCFRMTMEKKTIEVVAEPEDEESPTSFKLIAFFFCF